MKNFIYTIMIVATLLLLFNACETDKEIKLPAYHPKLVVHGYMALGDYFTVAVGKTLNITGTIVPDTASYVKDARVILFENGIRKDTLLYDSATQRYTSSKIIAITANTYKIIVEAAGYTTVEATATAPSVVNTELVRYQQNARFSSDGEALNDVTFRFHDPAAEQNYYLLELNRQTPYGNTRPDIEFCVYTYDPVIEQSQSDFNPFQNNSCIGSNSILFTDKKINGSDKQITISGQAGYMTEMQYNNDVYRPYLKKYNISSAFYQYVKDGITLRNLQDNPFAQPVTVSSNISNGYGLFTIYSVTVDTLR
ncbi:MAG: DUF4249 domain-containing protein [Chitinophagaceae bacterium]